MTKLRLRIDFSPSGSLGPGKVQLLEEVRKTGSISAAARRLEMSYRRAWLLIDDLNRIFREPVVSAAVGGKSGGGTVLTAFGDTLVEQYRAIEREAFVVASGRIGLLEDALKRDLGKSDAGEDAFAEDAALKPGCASARTSLARPCRQ